MASLHLYAELLISLRQISLFITLPTVSNDFTTVRFTDASRRAVSIEHDGEKAVLTLPCAVVTKDLSLPSQPVKEISFRLQADPAALVRADAEPTSSSAESTPAFDLPVPSRVGCVRCDATIVESVRQWKDLPSGGWADMMDLWHCHKPDVAGTKAPDAGSQKGYAAANALKPSVGCGLVDAGAFYFLPEDCRSLRVSTHRVAHV